eukprot:364533-Chlamydomonas_euryale.AAC.5
MSLCMLLAAAPGRPSPHLPTQHTCQGARLERGQASSVRRGADAGKAGRHMPTRGASKMGSSSRSEWASSGHPSCDH